MLPAWGLALAARVAGRRVERVRLGCNVAVINSGGSLNRAVQCVGKRLAVQAVWRHREGSLMQIIHVSSFPVSPKSKNLHAISTKLSNGFVRNGHSVINFSDRDVARAYGFGYRRWGRKRANYILREICALHKPQLLLLGHADVIYAETIAEIRNDQPDIRIVQWNVDPLFEPDNIRRIESKLDVVDVTLISTAGDLLRRFKRPGGIVGFMPNPVDFSIERGNVHECEDPPFDLFYPCGNPAKPLRHVFGVDWNMNDFITTLSDLCPKLNACLPGIKGAPHLVGALYQAALEQSAIGLNISRRQDFPFYSSDRMAHLAGNGLAVCMEYGSGFEHLFSGREVLFSSTLQELADQINELRAYPRLRQEIAAAGRDRYFRLFNERKVAHYIEEITFDRLDRSAYEWPTTPE
ncbi:hypothetical protein APM_0868 (plasmid) [Acidiphilium sp. PM]|nr:hypothetical protein APM_0868 [Acidiphilium sp. PM]